MDSNPHNPLVPKMQQQVEKLLRSRTEIFDELGRKRALEAQQREGADAKRVRSGPATTVAQLQIAPLGPGPHSLADVFTLTSHSGLRSFDAGAIPSDLVARIAVSTMARVDAQVLQTAVEVGGSLFNPFICPLTASGHQSTPQHHC